jgi:O-antigen ligase
MQSAAPTDGDGPMPPLGQAETLTGSRSASWLGARLDADLWVRGFLFVAALLLVWISVHPFAELSPATAVEADDAGDRLNQIAYLLLGAGFAFFLVKHDVRTLRPLVTPVFVLTLAWLVLSVLLSQHPGLSARRLTLAAIVIMIAGTLPLLPRNVRQFSDLTAGCVLIVLALCYLGVLVAPSLSIHQVADGLEDVVGNWRGLFSHKNTAGAMMALFIFIGLFVARARSLVVGGLIVALSAIFLWFSQSKTPITLVPIVLVLAPVLLAIRSTALRIVLALSLCAFLNLMTVGSVYFEPVRALLEGHMSDPTFTGRTFIWDFVRERLPAYLTHGYGFAAFWGSGEIVYGPTEAPAFVAALPSGHNSYIDLALTTGLPGLVLVVLWTVIGPALDLGRRPANREERLLALLFTQIWLFGLSASAFESIFLQRDDPTWFVFLVAIFGLRYLAVRRVVP